MSPQPAPSTVVVIGLGYIGLPTAALVSQKGFRVIGVDIHPQVVETINQGRIHIMEPSLEGLVHHAVSHGILKAVSSPEPGDVFIIAVPTPLTDHLRPDMNFVRSAVRSIIPVLRPGNLVLLESTSPVGTTEEIHSALLKSRPDLKEQLHVAYCPERVLPGRILVELEGNDRVVGGVNDASGKAAAAFYQRIVRGAVLITDSRTAEMVKLTENAYRDVNIAFANELSMICSTRGIDVEQLIQLANRHPRVQIHRPGCGVGGHCIAIDPWFIVDMAPESARLIRTAREINDEKPRWIVNRVLDRVEQFKKDKKRPPSLALFGLTYKPDVNDIRESPALKIAEMLAGQNLELRIVEPNLQNLPDVLQKFPQVTQVDQAEAMNADLGLMLVRHQQFSGIDMGGVN